MNNTELAPSASQRGSNTTSSQIKAIITYFESNKAYFDIVIGRNTGVPPTPGILVNKKQVYDALFTSLTQDQLIPGWTADTTKKRVSRIFSKFKETSKLSNTAGFRLSAKDSKKGITTIEGKLEALCPGYSRLLALFGERQDTPLYRISFHGPPDGPEYMYTSIPTASAATQRQQVLQEQEATAEPLTTLISETEREDNITETSSFVAETLEPAPAAENPAIVSRRSAIPISQVLSGSSSSDGSWDDSEIPYLNERMDSDFLSEYREAERQKLLSKYKEIKGTRSLGLLNATLEAIRTKTFGDASWREVTRIVKMMDAMISSDVDFLSPEEMVSVNDSVDEYEED